MHHLKNTSRLTSTLILILMAIMGIASASAANPVITIDNLRPYTSIKNGKIEVNVTVDLSLKDAQNLDLALYIWPICSNGKTSPAVAGQKSSYGMTYIKQPLNRVNYFDAGLMSSCTFTITPSKLPAGERTIRYYATVGYSSKAPTSSNALATSTTKTLDLNKDLLALGLPAKASPSTKQTASTSKSTTKTNSSSSYKKTASASKPATKATSSSKQTASASKQTKERKATKAERTYLNKIFGNSSSSSSSKKTVSTSSSKKNTASQPKVRTERIDGQNGQYTIVKYFPNGSKQVTLYGPCALCHGTGKCPNCHGTTNWFGARCCADGICKVCKGSRVSFINDKYYDSNGQQVANLNIYEGQDHSTKTKGGDPDAHKYDENGSWRDHKYKKVTRANCKYCHGTGINPNPTTMDPGHRAAKFNRDGDRCPICTKHKRHWHERCNSCN